jgi:hypothetical protein
MKSSKPPAIATWLLEHFTAKGNAKALAGDLSEEFCHGRSAGWYWRQVLVALFGSFWNKLRILWVAAGFTLVWIVALDASSQSLIRISRGRLFQVVFSWGLTLGWPLSEVYAITFFTVLTALPLLVSLSIYLGVMRRFNLRGLSQGLLVGMVGFAFAYVGLMLIPSSRYGFVGTFAGHVVGSLPLFVGLALSLWTARANDTGRSTTTLST